MAARHRGKEQAAVCAQMSLPVTASANTGRANPGRANPPEFQHAFAKVPASFAPSPCLLQNTQYWGNRELSPVNTNERELWQKQRLLEAALPHLGRLSWEPAHATASLSHCSSCLEHILGTHTRSQESSADREMRAGMCQAELWQASG